MKYSKKAPECPGAMSIHLCVLRMQMRAVRTGYPLSALGYAHAQWSCDCPGIHRSPIGLCRFACGSARHSVARAFLFAFRATTKQFQMNLLL